MHLQDFFVIRPNHEEEQKALLEWIAHAHVSTRSRTNNWDENDPSRTRFLRDLQDNLMKLGLGKNKIRKRGFQFDDWKHHEWQKMKVYNIESQPEGVHLDRRMELFDEASFALFQRIYPQNATLPPHLIHVTCTGYVAPSPAQKLVSLRKGNKTIVTHAYHMGCYGAIPSIRIAMGHCSLEKETTDIVHTEFCSLHMNPTFHTMEQLVVQSLFADGFIKYTLAKTASASSLKILAIHEQLLPDSTEKMTWSPRSWGFQMSIAKEIPVLIRKNIAPFLDLLAKKGGLQSMRKARFAIHPGGPKIIEQIADRLELHSEQIQHSKQIMENCGNMSSATLPHIWDSLLNDKQVKSGELIVSLAFGPGLSICGAIFEKRC